MKAKILIANSIAEVGVKILKDADFAVDMETKLTLEELKEKISDYDVLIVRSKTKVARDVIDSAKKGLP